MTPVTTATVTSRDGTAITWRGHRNGKYVRQLVTLDAQVPLEIAIDTLGVRDPEADTLLLTVPNQLGVDYNVHAIKSILEYVAPALGWR